MTTYDIVMLVDDDLVSEIRLLYNWDISQEV